ncbi:MAG: DUF465 domain-containing protein [Betaproteobacteria bacterium]|nr:DUF465 domain-containing protein [Betaproteobacteria bacterium]
MTNVQLTDEERAQLRMRIAQLEIEHRDLDDVIDRLIAIPARDELQMRRLKKRKLLLKDLISRLRARLIPDIVA